MSFLNVAQNAVHDALTGNLGSGVAVYDTTPKLPEAMPSTSFPYAVIGDDTMDPWDTDDTLGAEVTVTIHYWSRAKAFLEVKTIMGLAYDELHRATLTAAGYRFVDCLLEFQETMRDPDGVTKHGVQRYRLTIQKET